MKFVTDKMVFSDIFNCNAFFSAAYFIDINAHHFKRLTDLAYVFLVYFESIFHVSVLLCNKSVFKLLGQR